MPRPNVKRSKHKPLQDTAISRSTGPPATSITSKSSRSNDPINTTGLLALPVEVFARIQDELLAGSRLISREDVRTNATHIDDKSFQYRSDILRPLTQVCRVLRNIYVEGVYEHMEAYIVRGTKQWYKYLGDRLERLSDRCVREPDFAQRVRVVTVSLTRYSTDTVLPAFAKCLSHLPNLHTLRVCHAHSQMTTVLKNTFEGKQYPQIRTIILPTCAHHILRACPNVVDVTCNESDGSQLLSAMSKVCKDVEVLEGFGCISEATIKRLPKAVPKLRKLTLNEFSPLQNFGKLPCLSELVLKIHVYSGNATQVSAALADAIKQGSSRIDQGRAILQKSDTKSPKSLTVTYLVRDYETGPEWNGIPWKAGRTTVIKV